MGSLFSGYDYYETPIKLAQNFINTVKGTRFDIREDMIFLDPCAGTGVYVDILDLEEANIVAMDIRDDLDTNIVGNYIDTNIKDITGVEPNCIIMHPPLSKANEFIEKALSDVRYGGVVAAFLPLDFFTGPKMRGFYNKNRPDEIFAHSEHIKFSLTKGREHYMHALWKKTNSKREIAAFHLI